MLSTLQHIVQERLHSVRIRAARRRLAHRKILRALEHIRKSPAISRDKISPSIIHCHDSPVAINDNRVRFNRINHAAIEVRRRHRIVNFFSGLRCSRHARLCLHLRMLRILSFLQHAGSSMNIATRRGVGNRRTQI